jgi:hypothetical protein
LYLRDYNVKNAHVLSYDRIVISEGWWNLRDLFSCNKKVVYRNSKHLQYNIWKTLS